ncbi:hypothetical protein T03_12761 [Trichinella britovi]|uniref:Uncharacterized protein n=1 Tax=Trichinella britovi TaxID=45882 RepID=A0A0V1AKL8_TRIBR|nr:hypothetical protein T03_12761 [Trichinella britovi]
MKSCRKSLSAVISYLLPILQISYNPSISLRKEAKHQSICCKFSTKNEKHSRSLKRKNCNEYGVCGLLQICNSDLS